ncbi:MAG: bifunctional sugar phosphate isomerase/epimerase/4-hydroxyphenylpyruvate dioxygenase family protein [Hyphomicrobiaceae bacterium]
MKTGIATVCLSGDLDDKLVAIANAGFDGVEIFENDLLSFDGSPAHVGERIRDLGLECLVFQPFRDFEGLPEPARSRAFARAERKFDLMQELGTDLILICSNVSENALGGINRIAEDLHALGELAGARGLRVGYEALAWGRHINDHRDAWEAVRRADHASVGLILDSFHTLARDLPVESIQAIPPDKIFLVQVADAPLVDMDLLAWSRHLRNFPGQGDLPLAGFMQALMATGYDGYLSLEVFNDEFRGGSTKRLAVDGLRSLHYLIDQSAKSAVEPRQAEPAHPPPATTERVEFIEFCVDEASEAELAGLLTRLGFEAVGRHKSKEVTRYNQGDINIVLNADKDGFAHAYSAVHGTAVCAIGLRVEDAANAVERAARLGAQTYRQAVGPGELELPAIRGVGGSLIYFIDQKGALGQVWDIEFRSVDAPSSRKDAVGLKSVDHISQSMLYEEMLSWILFYRSIFDLEKRPQVDVMDPGGLVHSQAMQSANGEVRIALNAPHHGHSLTARFLSDYMDAGVQHIAFATGDIFATAEALKAGGLAMLSIPDNYYDDLEARFDLSDALMRQLREHQVLYDRDSTGEYFQIYTENFAGWLFFEIVERRNYAGFGATNAPIRLAAQTRSAPRRDMPRLGR